MSEVLFPSLEGQTKSEPDSSGLLIDYEVLRAHGDEFAKQYRSAEPFPHIVIDGFLPRTTIDRLLAEYPYDQDLPIWTDATYTHKETGEYVQKDKRFIQDSLKMPPTYRQLIWELNSRYFLDVLTKMSGITALISDPKLLGAGIHQIGTGGHLKVHADFTIHRNFGLDRRLNFLLYLNEDWREEYGGHLELWDPDMKGPPVRVLPVLNRCVIFSTSARSFHGHPKPLTCPPGVYRKSVALYYYTNGRPEGEAEPDIGTTWRDVPS